MSCERKTGNVGKSIDTVMKRGDFNVYTHEECTCKIVVQSSSIDCTGEVVARPAKKVPV